MIEGKDPIDISPCLKGMQRKCIDVREVLIGKTTQIPANAFVIGGCREDNLEDTSVLKRCLFMQPSLRRAERDVVSKPRVCL